MVQQGIRKNHLLNFRRFFGGGQGGLAVEPHKSVYWLCLHDFAPEKIQMHKESLPHPDTMNLVKKKIAQPVKDDLAFVKLYLLHLVGL